MLKMNKSLLCGYFGYGNEGDEAILDLSCALLRGRFPDMELNALSGNTEYTKNRQRISAVPAMSPFHVIKAIIASDCVVFCGGSVFQDKTSFKSLLYYSAICFLSRVFSKPYLLAFQGFGPFSRKLSERIMRFVLKNAAFVSVRDYNSFVYANQMIPNRSLQTSDPVFLTAVELPERQNTLKPKVCYIFKETDTEMTDMLFGSAVILKERYGAQIFHISLFPAQDSEICEKFVNTVGSLRIECHGAEEYIGEMTGMDLVISVRYHGFVFAARAGVPCLPVEYDPKVSALAKALGIKCFDKRWAESADEYITGRFDDSEYLNAATKEHIKAMTGAQDMLEALTRLSGHLDGGRIYCGGI